MKSVFTFFTFLGFILLLGGGFLLYTGLMGGWGLVASGIGAFMLFIGLLLIFLQFKISGGWNKVVDVFNSHETITIQEVSGKTGASPDMVRGIIYEAIATGDLSGTLDGDTFTRVK